MLVFDTFKPALVNAAGIHGKIYAADAASMIQCATLGRLVEPIEVGCAIAFSAGHQNDVIIGSNPSVDAGWLCCSPWQACGGLRKHADERS